MAQRTFASYLAAVAVIAAGGTLEAFAGCNRAQVQEPEPRATEAQSALAQPHPLSSRLARAAYGRIVAIGDLHGDLDHTRRALRLAGAMNAQDRWIGGRLVVVQTGDEIDRGDDDRAIVDLVEALKAQAATAGGEFVALLGNHEIMNALFDFRYVTPAGFEAFAKFARPDAAAAQGLGPLAAGRAIALGPGGPYAELLARRPIGARVGDTIFVHGGVLPKHVAYGLDRMNDEVDAWLLGKRSRPPAIATAEDGPIWTRAYSTEGAEAHCAELSAVLTALDAKRMVIGHTVQHSGINSACNGAVWRIDVGLSHYFGGPIEVLSIDGDEASVLREEIPVTR